MANTSRFWTATILGLALAAGCGDGGGDPQPGDDNDGHVSGSGVNVTSTEGCDLVKALGVCMVHVKTEEECADSEGTWSKCPTARLEGVCKDTYYEHEDAKVYYYSDEDDEPFRSSGGNAAADCPREYMGTFVKK